MKIGILYIITFVLFTSTGYAENQVRKPESVKAVRLQDDIVIDGILDEKVWSRAEMISGFIQKDPVEGIDPTQKTVVEVVFDDAALYIGARMYDTSPDSILARLSRRDAFVDSDEFGVFLDPYNDNMSGFYFVLNAAGTMYDGVLFNDNWDDNSWDGVWEGKANIDNEGWTAEIRIPFSQLRFQKKDKNVWGVNFRRTIARHNERDYLVYVPRNESGFVSHFTDLIGIDDINPPRQMEFLPYVTTRAEYTHPEPGNPFNSGKRYTPGLGADFKLGVGSNLTLDATINPDFGQVEIDPAVINLSDAETYFQEKRPFFIEGSTIFNFGQGGANNYWGFNWSSPSFFYSRRIGRAPQGGAPDSADFIDSPEGAHILGAAKLTGKIGDNWNVGTIQAVTKREFADYQTSGTRYESEVEPLTYYGIVRAQKEINEGRQGIGIISTYTSRMFNDDNLRGGINKNAVTGGIDGWTFLDSSKTWVLTGWGGFSHVTGSRERITDLQRSSSHYYQRPDAESYKVDSNATSLSGYAVRVYLNKQKGNFFSNSAIGILSPGFNVNDLGFIWRTDMINMHIGGGYAWKEPTEYYRYAELGAAFFRNYDFDGNKLWDGIFHFGNYQFTNYYSINWNYAYNPQTINNRRTRGGPLTLNMPGYQVNFSAMTDSRKEFVFDAGYFTYQQEKSHNWEIFTGIEYKPASNVSLRVEPFYSRDHDYSMWVNSVDDAAALKTYGKRYLFATFDQHTFGAGIRLNWTFNPKLSLQLYAQPLISAGNYYDYKELDRPLSYDFVTYGKDAGSSIEEIKTGDEVEYKVDPDGAGSAGTFTISNPDFNFISLRGNAVLRWEYLPGSVVYFVWTQSRTDSDSIGEFRFRKSANRMLNIRPDNIFMVKFTYWFNM